jgi:hypothetical protein
MYNAALTVARAKSRACLGFTTATGSPAAAKESRGHGPFKAPGGLQRGSPGHGTLLQRRPATRSEKRFRAGGVVIGTPKVWPRLPPLAARAARRPPLGGALLGDLHPRRLSLRALTWTIGGTSLVLWPPSLRMRALSPCLPREAPGNSVRALFAKRGARRDPTASCGLFGAGPEPVCRARPVDSTTPDKIQGPGSLRPWPVTDAGF